jgi:hypothetical protein
VPGHRGNCLEATFPASDLMLSLQMLVGAIDISDAPGQMVWKLPCMQAQYLLWSVPPVWKRQGAGLWSRRVG